MAACNHTINFPAIRAFNRAWNPIASMFDEACAAAFGYDAGEWSAPALDRDYQREMERVASHVAARFGMTSDELISQAQNCAPMHEQDVLIRKGLY